MAQILVGDPLIPCQIQGFRISSTFTTPEKNFIESEISFSSKRLVRNSWNSHAQKKLRSAARLLPECLGHFLSICCFQRKPSMSSCMTGHRFLLLSCFFFYSATYLLFVFPAPANMIVVSFSGCFGPHTKSIFYRKLQTFWIYFWNKFRIRNFHETNSSLQSVPIRDSTEKRGKRTGGPLNLIFIVNLFHCWEGHERAEKKWKKESLDGRDGCPKSSVTTVVRRAELI